MPSKIGLSYKREATTNRLRGATNKLRGRGVDVGGELAPIRDPDGQAQQELDQTADLLEAAVERLDELRDALGAAEASLETGPDMSALVERAAIIYAADKRTKSAVNVDAMIAAMEEAWIAGSAPTDADEGA